MASAGGRVDQPRIFSDSVTSEKQPVTCGKGRYV
jgi:hypothetical protein